MLDEKKTELLLAVVGGVGAVVTSVLGSGVISEGSMIALILGILATVCTYITQRGFVKTGKLKVLEAQQYKANELASVRTKLPNPQ